MIIYPRLKELCFRPHLSAFAALLLLLPHAARADAYDQQMEQGRKLLNEGSYADAEKIARSAVDLAIKDESARRKIANARQLLGEALAYGGNAKAALPEFEEALQIAEETTGEDSELVDLILNDLGMAAFQQNELEKSETYLKRSLALKEKSKKTGDLAYAQNLHNLATLAEKKREYPKAEDYYKQAITAYRTQGATNEFLAMSLMLYGQMLAVTNRPQEAIPLAEEAVMLFESRLGKDNPSTKRAQNFLNAIQPHS